MFDYCFGIPLYAANIRLFVGSVQSLSEYLTEVYNIEGHVDTTMDIRKLTELADKSSGYVSFIENKDDGDTEYFIWFREFPAHTKDYFWLNVFSHELLHLTQKILEYRGIHLSEATTEAYAYLQGRLFEILYSRILEEKFKKKKGKKK